MYPLCHLEQGCGRQTGADLPLPEVSEGAGVAGEGVVVQVGGLAGGTDVVGGGRGKLVVAGYGMIGYSTRVGVGLGAGRTDVSGGDYDTRVVAAIAAVAVAVVRIRIRIRGRFGVSRSHGEQSEEEQKLHLGRLCSSLPLP